MFDKLCVYQQRKRQRDGRRGGQRHTHRHNDTNIDTQKHTYTGINYKVAHKYFWVYLVKVKKYLRKKRNRFKNQLKKKVLK